MEIASVSHARLCQRPAPSQRARPSKAAVEAIGVPYPMDRTRQKRPATRLPRAGIYIARPLRLRLLLTITASARCRLALATCSSLAGHQRRIRHERLDAILREPRTRPAEAVQRARTNKTLARPKTQFQRVLLTAVSALTLRHVSTQQYTTIANWN